MGGSGKVSRGGVAGVCRVHLRHTSPCKGKARGVARRAQTGWGGRAGMSAHVAGARPVVFCGEHPARRDCEQHPGSHGFSWRCSWPRKHLGNTTCAEIDQQKWSGGSVGWEGGWAAWRRVRVLTCATACVFSRVGAAAVCSSAQSDNLRCSTSKPSRTCPACVSRRQRTPRAGRARWTAAPTAPTRTAFTTLPGVFALADPPRTEGAHGGRARARGRTARGECGGGGLRFDGGSGVARECEAGAVHTCVLAATPRSHSKRADARETGEACG